MAGYGISTVEDCSSCMCLCDSTVIFVLLVHNTTQFWTINFAFFASLIFVILQWLLLSGMETFTSEMVNGVQPMKEDLIY
jgi:hypothetical protein